MSYMRKYAVCAFVTKENRYEIRTTTDILEVAKMEVKKLQEIGNNAIIMKYSY